MSGICTEDNLIIKNQPQDVFDRRKRKSCDLEGLENLEDPKRSRIEEPETLPEIEPVQPTTIVATTSEDCSSSSGTSGIDVNDKSPESPSKGVVEGSGAEKLLSEVKFLTEFETFKPYTDHKLPSAIKTRGNEEIVAKKHSKGVRFDVVREFRFARTQSFVTMPSYGGCSLGMEKRHMSGRELGLDRYRIEREKSKRRKYRKWRKRQQVDVVTNSSSESDDDDDDDLSVEGMSGLLPVPPERRRRLLSQAGNVIENDLVQQSANQMVRTSRESCGCSCDGICYPETCECYINDIGCQVDRLSFPCGCLKDRCYNSNGRTSFNVERVRSHFYRTMHRLQQSRLAGIDNEPEIVHPTHQNYSFGDFTLPQGEPPLRNQDDYQMSMAWNQISCMNNMNPQMSYWNENCYTSINDRSQYDPWHHLNMPNNGINNMYPVNVANSSQMSNGYIGPIQDTSTLHISCAPTPNTTRMCALQTIDQSTENERLSESSESGIGEENVETPHNNISTGTTFPTCGGLETSITIAYNDDSNNSVPLSVGSE